MSSRYTLQIQNVAPCATNKLNTIYFNDNKKDCHTITIVSFL